jgi:nitrous oxidase accessory protein NosD
LTVSLKPEAGGTYRSINAALEAVRPGQTIRVLDDGVYQEDLLINRPSAQAGITLEAPAGATLERVRDAGNLIEIVAVPGVTVRDFRLRVNGARQCTLVFVHDNARHTMLERLDMAPGPARTEYHGVEVLRLRELPSDGQPSVTVRRCVIRKAQIGLIALGSTEDRQTPTPVCGLQVRDNEFLDCQGGVVLRGELRKVHVVGNHFRGCRFVACHLESLLRESGDILVANNTTFECGSWLWVVDDQIRTRDVRLVNNLALAGTAPDALAYLGGGSSGNPKGYADGKAYARQWDLRYNWREVRPMPGTPGWIPAGKKDTVRDQVDVVSRDPTSRDFLRPISDSGLAAQGAGVEDPTLPSYVGALPAAGAARWEWDRTWHMPRSAPLLTVSKSPADGGKYRTINAALTDARPWATVRVLDGATYTESVVLTDPEKCHGLTLEAPKRATLVLRNSAVLALGIQDVPEVRVRGFRVQAEPGGRVRFLVRAQGHIPGLVLEDLHLEAANLVIAVYLSDPSVAAAEAPIIIRGCRVHGVTNSDGIVLAGPAAPSRPARRIRVEDNRVRGVVRGIHLQGVLADTQVAGNVLWDCPQEGLGIEGLTGTGNHVLIANNTVWSCDAGMRVWDNEPFPEHSAAQAEFRNNLILSCLGADLRWVRMPREGKDPLPGNGESLIKIWLFANNWRDLVSVDPSVTLPLAPRDHKAEKLILLSQQASEPDFLRPPADSPLALAGVVRDGPALPAYVGAMPPPGVEPWDWDRTWRARVRPTP